MVGSPLYAAGFFLGARSAPFRVNRFATVLLLWERRSVNVLQASVENNAWWCHAVCASDGILGYFGQLLWSSPTRTPLLYPDAITLRPRVSVARVAAAIDRTSLGYSVKDSFADLDLTAYGFKPLFDASWISMERPALPPPATRSAHWSTLTSETDLDRWITAWGDSATYRFSPSLLADARVSFLAGDRDGELIAGAIAFDSAGVVGISNLFGPTRSLADVWFDVAHLVRQTTDVPIVGYESGTPLEAAQDVGFRCVGPLTVWGS